MMGLMKLVSGLEDAYTDTKNGFHGKFPEIPMNHWYDRQDSKLEIYRWCYFDISAYHNILIHEPPMRKT